jgi:hypothetical protein
MGFGITLTGTPEKAVLDRAFWASQLLGVTTWRVGQFV